MSTYQDRAREVLDIIVPRVGEHEGMTEEIREAVITKALSELASIVEKEKQTSKNEFADWLASIISVSRNIHGKNATIRLDTLETLLLDYSHKELEE